MKRIIVLLSATGLCITLTGCQVHGGGVGILAIFGALLGFCCMAVSVVKIYNHVSDVKRRRRRGLPVEDKLSPALFALAVIGLITLVVASMVWHTVRREAPTKTEESPSVTETTSPMQTEPTKPTEPTAAIPQEFSGEPTWMTFPEHREPTAEQYFVYSCDDGTFITVKGEENEVVHPADMTKLLTAYIALQHMAPTDMVTVGDALDLVPDGAPTANIRKNEVLTVEQLVEAIVLPGGSDAAYVLAVEVGRKLDGAALTADEAVKRFVKEMNLKAVECGVVAANFTNPDGTFDEKHTMTYHDLGVLGKLALGNDVIRRYATVAIDEVTFESGRKVSWVNTNELIFSGSPYYCPYAVGVMAGESSEEGYDLLAGFECNGKKIIVGVFGCAEQDDAFADALQLFNETLK